MSTPGMKLQWGPKEIEDLQIEVVHLQRVIDSLGQNIDSVADIIEDLKHAVETAPCLAAQPGELTYECRHDNLCRVCGWRQKTMRDIRLNHGIVW